MKFNDKYVNKFDLKNLEDEAFGSDKKIKFGVMGEPVPEKQNNAYLLFYERKKYYNENMTPIK